MNINFKQLLSEVNDYIIDFMEPQYIDYLDTIDFAKYYNLFAKIYIATLIYSDLVMFKYIHDKLKFSHKKLQLVFIKSLHKLSEHKLDYLIKNFNCDLINILLNKLNLSTFQLLLSYQSLNFNVKLFTIIHHDELEIIIRNLKYRFDVKEHYNILIISWFYNYIKPPHKFCYNFYKSICYYMRPEIIINHIYYNNINLNELLKILSTFNISHHIFIYLLNNHKTTLNNIARSANIDVIQWVFSQCKLSEYHILNSACHNINCYDVFSIIYNSFILQININNFILDTVLKYAVNCIDCKNINHTLQIYKIISFLIDVSTKMPIKNINLLSYYESIVIK